MPGKMTPFICSLVILIMVTGCGTAGNPGPATETFPTGKFVNGSYTWEFKADGSFISSGPPGSETGTYSVSGNQVVITCQCCGDATGNYTWAYTDNTLTFKVIKDKCSNRLEVVKNGQWAKTP